MSLTTKLLAASGGLEKLYSSDVFSAYTYTGNGATQTINNGIDLVGKGGMVWLKARSGPFPTTDHYITNTVSGVLKRLKSNTTDGELTVGATVFPSFNSDGFTISGAANDTNYPANNYASWTFRQSPKFFLNTTVTKSSGSNATVDLSSLGTVGMVMVKRTDAVGSWYVFHRSATVGKLLYLEQTAAEATLGHIMVSGTTLTLVNGVIADGSYVVYAWAHDSSADGIVQCGRFTTDGSGNASVSLGWEPQYAELKAISTTSDWFMLDQSRAWVATASKDASLSANTQAAEVTTASYGAPTATGFTASGLSASQTYVYTVIRRSNKPPTLGTQVYSAIARTGTGAAATVTGVGFAPDLCITKKRSVTTLTGARFTDRLRGKTLHLDSTATTAEVTTADTVTGFDVMDGFVLGVDATTSAFNTSGHTYINHFFKRATGVLDEVCYTGTGASNSVPHSLGVLPEFMFVKSRSATGQWGAAVSDDGGLNLRIPGSSSGDFALNSSGAVTQNILGNGYVTSTSAFRADLYFLDSTNKPNVNGATYVAYLFATKAGISKVGSYTGNGTSQTINCGFTTGARFVLIKRTDATGDWYVWDIVRGIVAGNDPHLSLNTTAAEVTTDDSIDPNILGFDIVQNSSTNINVTSGTYIFLAFA